MHPRGQPDAVVAQALQRGMLLVESRGVARQGMVGQRLERWLRSVGRIRVAGGCRRIHAGRGSVRIRVGRRCSGIRNGPHRDRGPLGRRQCEGGQQVLPHAIQRVGHQFGRGEAEADQPATVFGKGVSHAHGAQFRGLRGLAQQRGQTAHAAATLRVGHQAIVIEQVTRPVADRAVGIGGPCGGREDDGGLRRGDHHQRHQVRRIFEVQIIVGQIMGMPVARQLDREAEIGRPRGHFESAGGGPAKKGRRHGGFSGGVRGTGPCSRVRAGLADTGAGCRWHRARWCSPR